METRTVVGIDHTPEKEEQNVEISSSMLRERFHAGCLELNPLDG